MKFENNYKLSQILTIALMLSFAICIGKVASAQAATFADSPCDANYYKSLEARAWLEAQREVTQNQILILKPDSVLEYTCFDGHLSEVADHAKTMFSETSRWGSPPTDMAGALTDLVAVGLNKYDSGNFGTNFLGGSSAYSHTPASSVSAGSYSCEHMQKVWLEAKCMNVSSGFHTFDDYANGSADTRGCPGASATQATWTTNIDDAIPAVGATSPWEADPSVTYYERLFPTTGGACGSSGNNHVITGMIAKQSSEPKYYEENICLAPGCYWAPPTSGSGTLENPATGGTCTAS